MRIPKHPTLVKRMMQARVKKMQATGPVLAASLVKIARRCGREGCKCNRGQKHIGNYLTFKVEGKTKTVYVPKDLFSEVKAWIAEHKRMRRLSEEISQLAIAQIRTHVTNKKRRDGRS